MRLLGLPDDVLKVISDMTAYCPEEYGMLFNVKLMFDKDTVSKLQGVEVDVVINDISSAEKTAEELCSEYEALLRSSMPFLLQWKREFEVDSATLAMLHLEGAPHQTTIQQSKGAFLNAIHGLAEENNFKVMEVGTFDAGVAVNEYRFVVGAQLCSKPKTFKTSRLAKNTRSDSVEPRA